MSTLKIGAVPFEIIDTRQISRERVASDDGTTFLYQRWIIDAHVILNPQSVSWGGTPDAPVLLAGLMPAITDVNIRKAMRQDRTRITYAIGNDILLQSPATNEDVDANYGPIIESFNILQVFADKSLLCHIRASTCVSDCGQDFVTNNQPYGASDNPLLSLRWERHVDTDDTYSSSIFTDGVATFSAATLKRLSHYPDMYRGELAIPPPENCQRVSVQVAASSDGCSIKFRTVDKELTQNRGLNCPAVKTEAFHSSWFSRSGLGAATGAWGIGIAANLMGSLPIVGGAIRSITGMVGVPTPTGSLIPTVHESCFVRCWGIRTMPRTKLTRLALGICLWRLRDITSQHTYEVRIEQNVLGGSQFVEVTISKASAIIAVLPGPSAFPSFGIEPDGTVYPGLVAPTGMDTLLVAFADNPVGPGEARVFDSDTEITQNPAVRNPSPPNSSGTRGTLLEDVVAQVLAGQCNLGSGSRPATKPHIADKSISFPA